jgi:dihydrofolate reductase
MKLIVAFCKNRGIGLNNKMPWYLKSDLKRFKKLTMGQGNNAIVMGRNTWVSLKCLSLPKRSNIILTSKMDYFQTNNQLFMQSFDNVAAVSQSHLYDDIWLIGGAQVYRESLKKNLVDEIYATVIDNDFECDTFFPEIPKDFKIIDESEGRNENNINFNYIHYKKVEPDNW